VAAIDVGSNRGGQYGLASGFTYLTVDNPANGDGKLTQASFYNKYTSMAGLKIGTFYEVDTNKYACRSYVTIGSVSGIGQKQVAVNLIVKTGDLIGAFWVSGGIGCAGDDELRPGYNGDAMGGGTFTFSTTQSSPMDLSATGITSNPPTAPTSLLCEGQTNPIHVGDPTPEFSAVYNDDDSTDVATHAELQVLRIIEQLTYEDDSLGDFSNASVSSAKAYAGSKSMLLESTKTVTADYAEINAVSGGVCRFSCNLWIPASTDRRMKVRGTSGGDTLAWLRFNNGTFYCYDGSTYQSIGSHPTGEWFYFEFRQHYNAGTADITIGSTVYENVDVWNSATTPGAYIEVVAEGNDIYLDNWRFDVIYYQTWIDITDTDKGDRCGDISYAGATLEDGTQYTWQIRFRNDFGMEGAWSAGATFTTTPPPVPATVTCFG